jgi:hypothetical protein
MSYPDVHTSNYPQVGDPDPTANVPAEQRCGVRSDGTGRYRCTALAGHPDPRHLAGDGLTVVARWTHPECAEAAHLDGRLDTTLARILTVTEVANLIGRPLGTVRRWVLSGELVPDAHVGRTPVFYLHRVAPLCKTEPTT